MNRHFGRPGIIVHDLMHKAALTDTKMRNPDARDTVAGHKERFAWLNTLTLTIGDSVEFIQWGYEWAHYYRVYAGTVSVTVPFLRCSKRYIKERKEFLFFN